MSIRTNRMKAVPLLLKRLAIAEKDVDLSNLKSELMKIKDLFSMVKKNEDELLDTLIIVDGYLRKSNIHKLREEQEDICERIKHSTQKLLPTATIPSNNRHVAQPPRKTQLPSTTPPKPLNVFEQRYFSLDHVHRICLLYLLQFLPKNEVISRQNIIPWMIGLDLVGVEKPKSEQEGNNFLDKLWIEDLIVPSRPYYPPEVQMLWVNDRDVPYSWTRPYYTPEYHFFPEYHYPPDYHYPFKFKLNPIFDQESVRRFLQKEEEQQQPFHMYSKLITSSYPEKGCLTLDQHKVELSDGFASKSTHWRAILNVSACYLNFGPQWMAKLKRLEMLQLGRLFQASPKHHIEVVSQEFLKELGNKEHLKYLSLRGISTIYELPPSIFQIKSLETLDLKACHNLETLPEDIASLSNLKYLNMSQCYLLDRMPKGIEKLTDLEVLKGFVIGSSSKTPCRVSDIAKLHKLRQLSIHIGSGAVIHDGEFENLEELSLISLKISWGMSEAMYKDIQISLPSTLEKLHIEGFPGQNIPPWLMPDKLPEHLVGLGIKGGKLQHMDLDLYVKRLFDLRIICLKYLKHLILDPPHLKDFVVKQHLWYAQIKQVRNHDDFEWSIDNEGTASMT